MKTQKRTGRSRQNSANVAQLRFTNVICFVLTSNKRNKNIFINSFLLHGCRHCAVATSTRQNCSGYL